MALACDELRILARLYASTVPRGSTELLLDTARRAVPTSSSPAAAVPAASPIASTPAVAGDEAENDATHKRVMELLTSSGALFRTLTHTATKTSEESAKIRGVPLASGAKAMLLKAGKTLSHGSPYILAVMSASRTLDWPKIRKLLASPKFSMASLEDVRGITGCIPGAVPPFGQLFAGVATYVDQSLIDQGDTINFNAGLRTFSVCDLKVSEYLRIEKPTVADFTS